MVVGKGRGGHGMMSSEWDGETSTSWTMCDWFGVVSSAMGVGCVGTVLVSDSDVESSMSEGQTSTLCNACRREIQQCSWLELTRSLKHLLICGLVRWEDSTVMTWPVLEIEFAMAL